MTDPKVSVLMPVYNGQAYLREAVESILNQTLTDFEFIIVDDGSTDGTNAILQSYDDRRMVMVCQEHRGLVASLNKGLAIARGEYVARIDSDDIALPDRLGRQVSFMSVRPEIGILGTACRLIDADGRAHGLVQWPSDDLGIRWASLLGSPFAHPTVLIRRDILLKNRLNYNAAYQACEDYDLWTRLLHWTRGANLTDPLVQYRVRSASVSHRSRALQLMNHDFVSSRSVKTQLPGFRINPEQVSQLRRLFVGGSDSLSDLVAQRMSGAGKYLDMFKVFKSRNTGEPGLQRLERQVALKVARIVLRPPMKPGWVGLIVRLMKSYPFLPWFCLGYLAKAVGLRIKRRTIDRFHFRRRIRPMVGPTKQ